MTSEDTTFLYDCAVLSRDIWDDDSAEYISSDETDAECSVKIINQTIFVVFKFTDSKKDWEHNIRFLPDTIKYHCLEFKVHKGFWEQFISIWDEVRSTVSNMLDNHDGYVKDLVFTGYSLGGGLSQIASYLYKADFTITIDKPFRTVIFASPRTGNRSFMNIIDNDVYHVFYRNDPVPSAVPLFLGYCDPSHVLHIEGRSGTDETDNRGYFESVGILCVVIFKKIFRLSWVSDYCDDHKLDNIIEHFEKDYDEKNGNEKNDLIVNKS